MYTRYYHIGKESIHLAVEESNVVFSGPFNFLDGKAFPNCISLIKFDLSIRKMVLTCSLAIFT